MDELIKKKCEDAGISPDLLTDSELYRLRNEIKAEQQGKVILDGVLSNPKITRRGW